MNKFLSIALLSSLLSACSGGTIGGLIPAPKIVNGSLEGTLYNAPDDRFSVKAPVTEENGEWLYTEVHENEIKDTEKDHYFVGFKPPYNNHLYVADVIFYKNVAQLTQEQFSKYVETSLSDIKKYQESNFSVGVEVEEKEPFVCQNDDKFTYAILKHQYANNGNVHYKWLLVSYSHKNGEVVRLLSDLNFEKADHIDFSKLDSKNYIKHKEFVCSFEFGS